MDVLSTLRRAMNESASIPLGLIANGLAVALTLPFILVPSGEWIRPMGWAMCMGLIALTSALLGASTALFDVREGRRRMAALGFALCLTPFFVASGLLQVLALIKGFGLSP